MIERNKLKWIVSRLRYKAPYMVLSLAATSIFICAASANSYFSMCSNDGVSKNPIYIQKIIDAGASSCRTDLSFAGTRSKPDTWDWTLPDAVRKVANAYPQIEWVPILGYGTAWAADPKFAAVPGVISAPQRGINVMPAESAGNLYGNYVYEMVKRYKDSFHIWESWNEPDLPVHSFFKGNGADFMPYQRACYLAAKHADPKCTVLFAGLTFANIEGYMYAHHLKPPTTSPAHSSFFEEYLQAVVKDPNAKANNYYFDVMNQHSYSRATDLFDYSQILKKLMKDYLGREKPIWFTETGWVDVGGPWGGTKEEYCDYLLQSYCWAQQAGVQRNYHFQLDNSNGHGLYTSTLGPPKVALQTYKLMTHEFNDLKFQAQLHGRAGIGFLEGNSPYQPTWQTGFNLFEFKSNDGKRRVLIAFTDTGKPLDIKVPARKQSAFLIDRFGNKQQIRANGSFYELHLAGATNNAGYPTLPEASAKAMGKPEHLVGGATQIIVEAQ